MADLFGFPDEIFGPLAAQNRHEYARVIKVVYLAYFADGLGAPISQSEVLSAIRTELEAYTAEADIAPADDAAEIARPNDIYNQLKRWGWFNEYRERFHTYVEMPTSAIRLLDFLLDMEAFGSRNITADLSSILNNLRAAHEDPQRRGISILSALRTARDFIRHLNAVASGMRRIEQEMLQEGDIAALYVNFFENFVAQVFCSDYETLVTRNNPYAFREDILDTLDRIAANTGIVGAIVRCYMETDPRRYPDRETALGCLNQDLHGIRSAVQAFEANLDRINAAKTRIERLLANIMHYAHRSASTSVEKIDEAIRRLANPKLPNKLVVAVPSLLVPEHSSIGVACLAQPRHRRNPAPDTPVELRENDPEALLYFEAAEQYSDLVTITADRIRGFMWRHLAGREEVQAGEIPIHDLREFLEIERLLGLDDQLFEAIAEDYVIERLPGFIENAWVKCPKFAIRRAAARHAQPIEA